MSHFDYLVLVSYFAFMLVIGWVFRRFVNNVSDYFRGGGKAVWWLVGGAAFMAQFSAWTFTGAAGMAYENGWPITAIYIGNVLGFLLSAAWFAPRFRQVRVVTGLEAVRLRFGRANEQVFTWLQVPLGTLQAGIWLYALSKFFSAVFGLDITVTIVATGLVVLMIALLGGSWGVLASDFIQVLILMPVCLVLTVFSLAKVGGVAAFVEKLPAGHLSPNIVFSHNFLLLWCLAMLLKQVTVTNNFIDANRFLAAKDSAHARKAALLSAALFAAGIFIWFVPPMAARILYPDLAAVFPNINTHLEETSFIAVARGLLPVGMMGLLVSGIFASTMSAMDGGLNKAAGIFIKNFYQVVVSPRAAERHLLRVSKVTTVFLGAIVILVAVRMSMWEHYSLFLLTQRVSILIGIPILVPLFLGVFIKRTPAWAAWSTALLGFVSSLVVDQFLPVDWSGSLGGGVFEVLNISVEYKKQAVEMFCNFAVGLLWFWVCSFFWKRTPEAHKANVAEFEKRISTPVDFSKEEGAGAANDQRQLRVIGRLCIGYGAFITLLMAIPNSLAGRLAFVFCGGAVLLLGALFVRRARVYERRLGQYLEAIPHEARKESVIFAALTSWEARDFLPGSLLGELNALAGDAPAGKLVMWDPNTHSTAEFYGALNTLNPGIILAAWKTPPLPPPRAMPPGVRYVCYMCGSVKNLITRGHLEAGLVVTNWGGSISRIVAEWALFHILSSLRRATYWSIAMHRQGAWKSSGTETGSLFGRSVGIHGFGMVSKELIRILRPFGARLAVYWPDLDDAAAQEWQVERASSLEQIFSSNDIIVELAPLNRQTRGIVDERLLRMIREGGVFINIGRGAVVDEAALIRVAREGKINIGLDVFSVEPLPVDHPLRGLSNVTLTPHLGGPTTDRRRDAGAFALRNLRAYMAGEPLQAQVTVEIFDKAS